MRLRAVLIAPCVLAWLAGDAVAETLRCLSGSIELEHVFPSEPERRVTEALHIAEERSGRSALGVQAANVPDLCAAVGGTAPAIFYSRRWLYAFEDQNGPDEAALALAIEQLLRSVTTIGRDPKMVAPVKRGSLICWPRVIPPVFKIVLQSVVVEEASEGLIVVPPTFQTVTETIVIRPAHFSGDRLETTHETVVVRKAYETLQVVPATYKTVPERIVVAEAYDIFEVDGGTIRHVLVPAKTGTVQRRVVDEPPSIKRIDVPPKTVPISIQIVAESTGRGHRIPARTLTIKRQIVRTPTSTRAVARPGKTATVTTRVVDTPASVSEGCD